MSHLSLDQISQLVRPRNWGKKEREGGGEGEKVSSWVLSPPLSFFVVFFVCLPAKRDTSMVNGSAATENSAAGPSSELLSEKF